MVDIGALGADVESLTTVGIVLVEAIVLYVGYGALTRVAGDGIMDAIRGK
ncbi:DUF7512 family protein [Haladaptatus sp. NG-WS-4]